MNELNEINLLSQLKVALPKKLIVCGQYKDLNYETN